MTPQQQRYQRFVAQIMHDRKEALLSLDEATIKAYMVKYSIPIPADEATFWATVHKTRTAAADLPMPARSASKQWLFARGLKSMDAGDVPFPKPDEPA